MAASTTENSILVLGAGELGNAILSSILAHSSYSPETTPVTLLLRPNTLNSPSAQKKAQHDRFRANSIALISGDIDTDNEASLTSIFSRYTTVIHAAGMTSPEGTQTKVTRAVLAAEVHFYVPWQHGVDYDVIGREGGFGLFSEQVGVREMLRAQTTTQWVIISCGIFMSFLFEEFWGVVTHHTLDPDSNSCCDSSSSIKVTALNSWDDLITTTTAEDIGRCTAEITLNPAEERNHPIFIAGDTLTYGQFADVVERVATERDPEMVVKREVWPLEYLKEEARKDPDTKLKKYRVVFSEGRGLSWPKNRTWNARRGMSMEGVESWMRQNWKS